MEDLSLINSLLHHYIYSELTLIIIKIWQKYVAEY